MFDLGRSNMTSGSEMSQKRDLDWSQTDRFSPLGYYIFCCWNYGGAARGERQKPVGGDRKSLFFKYFKETKK